MKEADSTISEAIKLVSDGVVVKPSTFLEGELGIIANKLFQPCNLVFTVNGPISSNRTKYSFQSGPNEHIEPLIGTDGRPGLGHYLNHSCDPNAYIYTVNNKEDRYIEVVAYKEIKKGEEIKVDYAAMEFETTVSQLPCKCGSLRCRGRINGYKDLPAAKISEYISKGLIPTYLLELEQENNINSQEANLD